MEALPGRTPGGSWYVLFGHASKAVDYFACVLAGSAFLAPNGGSETDALGPEFVLDDASVSGELEVDVVLDGVAWCFL